MHTLGLYTNTTKPTYISGVVAMCSAKAVSNKLVLRVRRPIMPRA